MGSRLNSFSKAERPSSYRLHSVWRQASTYRGLLLNFEPACIAPSLARTISELFPAVRTALFRANGRWRPQLAVVNTWAWFPLRALHVELPITGRVGVGFTSISAKGVELWDIPCTGNCPKLSRVRERRHFNFSHPWASRCRLYTWLQLSNEGVACVGSTRQHACGRKPRVSAWTLCVWTSFRRCKCTVKIQPVGNFDVTSSQNVEKWSGRRVSLSRGYVDS